MTLLRLENISAAYGPAQALFDVHLDVAKGEVLALMGRNGMGKTTTVKTICRMLPHNAGTLTFAGKNMDQVPIHKAAQMGLGLVPEGRRCFGPLTVHENLMATSRKGAWDFSSVTTLFPRLAERQGQVASSLSGGEQQMLAIGRALMTNPRLLILDEATEGLAPVMRQEIWAVIARLKREAGLAIIVVDKSLRELRSVADKGVILEKGVTVWADRFAALTPDLTDRYLGV